MKNFNFLLGIGVLALASCSNDEMVVNPAVDGASGEAAIGFAVSTGNMSRADGVSHATQLSEEYLQFGVWAYKRSDTKVDDVVTKGEEVLVMDDYMVGFWNGTYGYKPEADQQRYGTNWYYEGLGYDEFGTGKGHTFFAGGPATAREISHRDVQYLKYWDKTPNTNTWFYGYAPYNFPEATFGTGAKVTFSIADHAMTFPRITANTGAEVMYAVTKKESPAADVKVVDKSQFVNMKFYRLLSKIRVAFYEVIPGYSVELIPFSDKYEIPKDEPWDDWKSNAMFAVPSKYDAEQSKYVTGEYVNAAVPVVKFEETDFLSPNIYYSTAEKTSDNINIPLWFQPIDQPTAEHTCVLGTTKDKAIVNETMNVLPADKGEGNDGFTLNLSLKLVADDTKEEILIKGIKVHVPADDCQWLPNHLYTYYFKITKTVPGKPTDPEKPDPKPDPDPYLLPIVFDNVTVEVFEDHKVNNGDYNVGNE